MAFDIHTEIEIAATAEHVWATLTDTAALPDWNPVLKRLEGNLEVGGRLRISIRTGWLRLPLTVRVTKAEPGRALEWVGGPRLLLGARHGFSIEPAHDDRVRLVHYEHFEGLAVRVLQPVLRRLRRDYAGMNEALKARAET